MKVYLVVGVPVEELIKEEETIELVTRYNETTGQPYQKEIKGTFTTLCGRRVEDGAQEDILTDADVEYFRAGYESPGPIICGVAVSSVADSNSDSRANVLKKITPLMISDATTQALNKLRKLGYEGQVGLYLVMQESY